MIRSILVLLSFHSDGSLEHDPEGEMKNLPRSLLKYLRRFHRSDGLHWRGESCGGRTRKENVPLAEPEARDFALPREAQ